MSFLFFYSKTPRLRLVWLFWAWWRLHLGIHNHISIARSLTWSPLASRVIHLRRCKTLRKSHRRFSRRNDSPSKTDFDSRQRTETGNKMEKRKEKEKQTQKPNVKRKENEGKKKKGKKRTQAQNFAVVFIGLSCGCHGLDEVGAWLVWLGKGDEVWRGMLDLGMEKSFCGLGFWCEGKSCWWGRKGELDLTRHWQWVHACVFNYKNVIENWVLETENT